MFSAGVESGPKAALVISSLRIEFHRPDGSLDACFFALDRGDLFRLSAVVDRALRKTDALTRFIERAQLPYWEYTDFDDNATSD